MRSKLTRELFTRMLREEWRMHAHLFGGVRFAAFPLLVAVLTTTAVWGLLDMGTEVSQIAVGVHVLVFLFGLHTGSIGLVGRDAVENLLGDVTLIVYSARTLPISRKRLLSIFLLKDAVYYSGLFLVPIAVSFTPAALSVGNLGLVGVLWASLTGTFLLGASLTLVVIGVTSRWGAGVLGGLALLAGAGAWVGGERAVALTPYGFYADPSVGSALLGGALIPVLGAVGVLTYDLSAESRERTSRARLRSTVRAIPRVGTPELSKTLLDLHRSSGGLWKVVFSSGIIFGVSVAMVEAVKAILGVNPTEPIAVGAMLGLSAFTTYNWLTQFDSESDYLRFPLDIDDVYRAKFWAFVATGIPTGLAYYAASVVLYGGTPEVVVSGAVVTVWMQLYLFGLTARLAGLSPNEFMFDTALFATFTAAVGAILVPILVVSLVLGELSLVVLAGIVAVAIGGGSLGVWMYDR